MRNGQHVGYVLVVLAIAQGMAAAKPRSGSRPNIVIILADDLGYGDVGCYNPESKIPTPNIDLLATQGMRFTDAHSPCTVCTPTRYSLLTGQMAFRVRNGGRVFTGAGGPSLIAPDRLTLPEMLRSQGYSTACIGKWHIGLTFYDHMGNPIHKDDLASVRRIDYARPIDGGPLDCGFERFFGTACCPTTDWLYAFIDGKRIPNPPGESSAEPLSLTDVMATVAEITGFTLPVDAAEDSFNMLPAMLDAGKTDPIRPYLLQQGFGGKKYLAIRRGKWKYLAHKGSGGNNYETHPMLKEYAHPDTAPNVPGQLFDMENDPGELHNMAAMRSIVVDLAKDPERAAEHRSGSC